MVSANISYAILVAKHNCGFATWPTAVKLPNEAKYGYDIAHSSAPPGCNIVASFLDSCSRFGLRAGMYYSFATNLYLNVQGAIVQNRTLLPGMASVTQKQFFDIALGQVEELWSSAPRELFELWADGGLPQDPYFHSGLVALKERYQPQAVFYNGAPSFNQTAVRWIGNEDGTAPDPTWSTGSCDMGNGGHGPLPEGGDPNSPYWCPAEVDSTLQAQDSWFYVQAAPLNSLRALVQSYHESVGRNSNWVLGLSPGPDGRLAPAHHELCAQLGSWLRACFDKPAAAGAMAAGHSRLEVVLPEDGVLLNRIRLREDQSRGQRVRAYNLSMDEDWSSENVKRLKAAQKAHGPFKRLRKPWALLAATVGAACETGNHTSSGMAAFEATGSAFMSTSVGFPS
jgi:alpha-L-fucosidase